jgi:hypothetical protein
MYDDPAVCPRLPQAAVALVNRGSAAASKGARRALRATNKHPVPAHRARRDRSGEQELLGALTAPLAGGPSERFSRAISRGPALPDKHGWTDSLLIHRSAIDAMLTAPICRPTMSSARGSSGSATPAVKKIAINAVMAGALPTRAVEAMRDPLSGYGIFEVSTGSWAVRAPETN